MNNELRLKREQYDIKRPKNTPKVIRESGEEYCGRIILSREDTAHRIYEMLTGDKPVMISRFGENELRATVSGLCDKYPNFLWQRHLKNMEYDGLFSGAGVFPRDINLIPKFADVFTESCKNIDMLGVWFNRYEDMIIDEYCPKSMEICPLSFLEPYTNINEPWSYALKDRKVLVVHPFTESIMKQYEKRKVLFENDKVLPDMDLKVYKSVQTIAGQRDRRYRNWFKALNGMYEEISKIDYDVAVVGCGAYGLPLASMMKNDGKKVVHLGGATQILFGIKGKRWFTKPNVKRMFNDEWIFPSADETPAKLRKVEDGCYWGGDEK